MITPATAAAFSYVGNSVTCLVLPRKPLTDIYLNGTQLKENDEATAAWIGHPITGGLMILLIVATFYHAVLGLQVVIEDYVHGEGKKIAAILLIKFAGILLGLAGVLAVLKTILA